VFQCLLIGQINILNAGILAPNPEDCVLLLS
jgi:hypothetical protein